MKLVIEKNIATEFSYLTAQLTIISINLAKKAFPFIEGIVLGQIVSILHNLTMLYYNKIDLVQLQIQVISIN